MSTRLYVRYTLFIGLVLLLGVVVHRAIRDEGNQKTFSRWDRALRQVLLPGSSMTHQIHFIGMESETKRDREYAGLLEYARVRLGQPRSSEDIFELGMQLRALKAYLDSQPDAKTSPFAASQVAVGLGEGGGRIGSTFDILQDEHFSWALKKFPSLFDLRASFTQARGIVIPTGKRYFRFAVHLIRSIREVFRSSLPIQVYYMGRGDLNATHIDYLRVKWKVEAVDITSIFDNSILKLRGWDIKPFALLAAPFRQVLLLDADSVLVQAPEVLFQDSGYIRDGALFFHDRTLFPTDLHKQAWLAGLFPKPLSERLKALRYYRMETTYEQEAGLVLVDKQRHFAAVLAVCRLNTPPERDAVIHVETHGDKETYWLGFELVGHAYAFMPFLPGSIGAVQVDYEDRTRLAICGKLAHFDRNGTLLWFNDAICDNKKDEDWVTGVPELTHWSREGTWTPYLCMHGPRHPLTEAEQAVVRRLATVYDPYPLNSWNK